MSCQHSTEGDVQEKQHEKDGGARGERARATQKELIACQQLLDNGVFPSWLLLSQGQFVLMMEQSGEGSLGERVFALPARARCYSGLEEVWQQMSAPGSSSSGINYSCVMTIWLCFEVSPPIPLPRHKRGPSSQISFACTFCRVSSTPHPRVECVPPVLFGDLLSSDLKAH